jgi:hypothetical protein
MKCRDYSYFSIIYFSLAGQKSGLRIWSSILCHNSILYRHREKIAYIVLMEMFILYIVDIHYHQVPANLVRGATMPSALLEKYTSFISHQFSDLQ